MPIPEGMKFSLAPVINRLNEINHKCGSWRRGLHNREKMIFASDDFVALLDAALPALDLPQEKLKGTADDYGVLDNDTTAEGQSVHRYVQEVEGTDRLTPFREMLQWYNGRHITRDAVNELYWRLAAGRDWMLKGRRLEHEFPGIGKSSQFWTGLHISTCRYGPLSKTGKLQLTLGFRVMGGPFAGLGFAQNIPFFIVTRKIAKEIGFPLFQKTHYNELVQCVFVGCVELQLWGERLVPRVVEYHISPAATKLNQKLRKKRAEECPHEGYTWPCYQCTRGYLDTGEKYCVRGTRPYSLVKRACLGCNKASWFDADSNSAVCVSCQARPYKLLDR